MMHHEVHIIPLKGGHAIMCAGSLSLGHLMKLSYRFC